MLHEVKERTLALLRGVGVGAYVASSGWRRRRLLILCYHGVSRSDEHLWRPTLYVSAEQFARRMEWLQRLKCHVLPLGEAVDRMVHSDLPDRAVALTFDDGYCDFGAVAYPVLRQYGYAATVYLTTWRCEHNAPIARLLISYLLWRRRDGVLEGEGLPGLAPGPHLLATAVAREAILDRLMAAVRPAACDQDRNDGLARAVAQRLSFDYEQFASMRMLTLLAPHEVIQLAADGVDFQLHTHRHRSPDDAALLTREIRENRERVERMTGRPATHFCWPSGVYWRTQLATLAAESVVTATTCEPGFARADSEPLLLPRFVDTSFVSDNAFASWLEGTAALGARRP